MELPTSSGTYTWVGTNSVGCDSTATLVLTINLPTTSSSTVTECDNYIWNGTNYTTSGTYTWVGTNSVGCDSTATLVLTINLPTTSSSKCQHVIVTHGMELLTQHQEHIHGLERIQWDVIVL